MSSAESRASLNKVSVSWADVERMVGTLLRVLPRDRDALLVITRGGMVPACLISERIRIRNILSAAVVLYDEKERLLPDDHHVEGRRILVVDDVWDSGRTIMVVRDRLRKSGARVDMCVLHYKPRRSCFAGDGPDYYAEETDAWIMYPWEPVEAKSTFSKQDGAVGEGGSVDV